MAKYITEDALSPFPGGWFGPGNPVVSAGSGKGESSMEQPHDRPGRSRRHRKPTVSDEGTQPLGLFSLPHVVLFPNTLLPLHVFEPRYRALLRDALGGSGRFVVGTLARSGGGLFRTATIGRVVEHQPLEDGCSDIILQGERVVDVVETVREKPYPRVLVEERASRGEFAEGAGALERCRELQLLLEKACPGCVKGLRERMGGDFESTCGIELLHTVAMYLPVGVEKKVAWLSCEGSLARWEAIRSTLLEMGRSRSRRLTAIRTYEDVRPEDPAAN